jgi:hypothetical protein
MGGMPILPKTPYGVVTNEKAPTTARRGTRYPFFWLLPGVILVCYFAGARPEFLWLSLFLPNPPWRRLGPDPTHLRASRTAQAGVKMTLPVAASSHMLILLGSAGQVRFLELFLKNISRRKSCVSVQRTKPTAQDLAASLSLPILTGSDAERVASTKITYPA